MSVFHQPAHHLIERPLVGHVELLRVVRAFRFRVAAHARAGRAADLGHAEVEQPAAHRLALAGGDDDAGIRHRQADAGGDLFKDLVGDAVVKLVRIDVRRALEPRHADGVRAHAVHGLQVLRVHDEPGELVLVQLQAEQHAQTHVVDAALHRAVHRLSVVVVVVLGAGGMQLQIALLVIRLLEEDVGADARVLEPAVVFHRSRGDVHVHAADGAVLVVDGVNRFDALEDVLDGVVLRVLSRLDRQALVAHVLQRDDLLPDLLLRQLAARDGLVLHVIRTVHAAVHAVV